jgi:hypothetical protein
VFIGGAFPDGCIPAALLPLAAGAPAAGGLFAGGGLPLMAAGGPAGVAVLACAFEPVLLLPAVVGAAPPLPPLPARDAGGAQRKTPELSLVIFAPGQDDNPSVPSSPQAKSNVHAIDSAATTCFIPTPFARARV